MIYCSHIKSFTESFTKHFIIESLLHTIALFTMFNVYLNINDLIIFLLLQKSTYMLMWHTQNVLSIKTTCGKIIITY